MKTSIQIEGPSVNTDQAERGFFQEMQARGAKWNGCLILRLRRHWNVLRDFRDMAKRRGDTEAVEKFQTEMDWVMGFVNYLYDFMWTWFGGDSAWNAPINTANCPQVLSPSGLEGLGVVVSKVVIVTAIVTAGGIMGFALYLIERGASQAISYSRTLGFCQEEGISAEQCRMALMTHGEIFERGDVFSFFKRPTGWLTIVGVGAGAYGIHRYSRRKKEQEKV